MRLGATGATGATGAIGAALLLAAAMLSAQSVPVNTSPSSPAPVAPTPVAPTLVAPVAPVAPSRTQSHPDRDDFAKFLESVKTEALSRGISEQTVNRALTGLEPSATVIERDQTQAEVVLTIDQYLQRRLTASVVRTARQMATRHRAVLNRVSTTYGVPARVIVSVWGLESNFGRFSGVRPTIQALATLAWEGRRGAFFRAELLDALEVVDRGFISLERLRGSWAGALGQPQFMPSSYLKWAQDFDQDGDRDIWTSPEDIFASIANYLKEHGWTTGRTWGREVRVTGSVDEVRTAAGLRSEGCRAAREMTMRLPLSEWQSLGIRTTAGGALPKVDLEASLVHTGKRAFLLYGNYEALLEYNCAHSYALAVALLSEQIRS